MDIWPVREIECHCWVIFIHVGYCVWTVITWCEFHNAFFTFSLVFISSMKCGQVNTSADFEGEGRCSLFISLDWLWNFCGMKLVEVLTVFIMSKCMWGRACAQPSWFHSMWYQRAWFTILLVCLLVPSVCGWYAVDIFNLMPVSLCKAFQKHNMNSLSQSETMLLGRPFSQYHLLKNMPARCSAVILVQVSTNWISLPSWSVKVTIQFMPSSSSSGPMKSIATESPCLSGTGRGCNSPYGLIVADLLCWQSGQEGA